MTPCNILYEGVLIMCFWRYMLLIENWCWISQMLDSIIWFGSLKESDIAFEVISRIINKDIQFDHGTVMRSYFASATVFLASCFLKIYIQSLLSSYFNILGKPLTVKSDISVRSMGPISETEMVSTVCIPLAWYANNGTL